MLGTLTDDQKLDWPTYVGPLVQAYNSTRHDSTGFSPHYLLFGWHPRLSVDAFLDTGKDTAAMRPDNYVQRLKERMKYAYQLAGQNAQKRAAINKKNYDAKVRENRLEVGDMVLVQKVGLKGRHKLADRWERDPYTIVGIPDPDVPVYQISMESRKGHVRTVHRNFLLPFVTVPEDDDIPEVTNPKPPKTRRPVTRATAKDDGSSESDSSSSDDSVIHYVIPQRRNTNVRPSPIVTRRQGSRTLNASSTPYESLPTSTSPLRPTIPADTAIQPDVSPPVSLTGSRSTAPPSALEASPSTNDSQHPSLPPPPPEVPVVPEGRPVRRRKPPDRFGEWVSGINTLDCIYYV